MRGGSEPTPRHEAFPARCVPRFSIPHPIAEIKDAKIERLTPLLSCMRTVNLAGLLWPRSFWLVPGAQPRRPSRSAVTRAFCTRLNTVEMRNSGVLPLATTTSSPLISTISDCFVVLDSPCTCASMGCVPLLKMADLAHPHVRRTLPQHAGGALAAQRWWRRAAAAAASALGACTRERLAERLCACSRLAALKAVVVSAEQDRDVRAGRAY